MRNFIDLNLYIQFEVLGCVISIILYEFRSLKRWSERMLNRLIFPVSYVGGGVRCPNCKICFCRTEKMPINISPRKRFSLGCESYCIRFNFSAKKQKGKKFSSKTIMEFDRTSVTSGV